MAPKTNDPPTATTTTTTTTAPDQGSRLDKIENKLDALISSLHKDAGTTTTDRLEAPNSIAEEVQAELDRRSAASKRQEEAERLGKVEQAVGALSEKAPEPVVRKVEKLMGWRNDS